MQYNNWTEEWFVLSLLVVNKRSDNFINAAVSEVTTLSSGIFYSTLLYEIHTGT